MTGVGGLIGAAVLLVLAGLPPAAEGQEQTQPPLIFILPAVPSPSSAPTFTRDDLGHVPAPRVDRPPASVSGTIFIDDQCLPGESPTFIRSRRDGRVGRPARPR
jgi:hypothetical protein